MEELIRINKYLSEAGFCSRREADRLLEAGKVIVDGMILKPGDKVTKGQKIFVNGKEVHVQDEKVLLAFYKPQGIECTAEKRVKNNIIDYMNYPIRLVYAGRLDKDSEGLILMTNEGDMINKMMRAGNQHEKEYIVTVDKPLTEAFIEGMGSGVPILDTITRKCYVEKISEKKFRIVLTQGLNRQIRRMCEYFNYHTVSLKRVRVMNIMLGDLKPGEYREVTKEERNQLERMIMGSYNTRNKA